jgi:hypothetical protein
MDKQDLFVPRLPEEDVEIPGVGMVRVRGLSRQELLDYHAREKSSGAEGERYLLSVCLIDPKLTEGEARQWQEAATSEEFDNLVDAIRFLSGLMDDAAKAAYKSVRDESDA